MYSMWRHVQNESNFKLELLVEFYASQIDSSFRLGQEQVKSSFQQPNLQSQAKILTSLKSIVSYTKRSRVFIYF